MVTPRQVVIEFSTKPFNVAGLPVYSAAMRARNTGQSDVRILNIGDSTTRGVGGGSGVSDPAQFLNSWPRKLAARMSKYNGVSENVMGQAGIVLANYDSRIDIGGWTTVSESLGGPGFQTSSGVSDVVFTPTAPISQIDAYYITSGGGTFTVNVDGGTSLGTINCGGANGYFKQSFSVPLGTHAIHAHWVSTNSYLAGFDAWDASRKVVRFINAARSGNKTSDWLVATNAWSCFNVLGVPQPHLIMIQLGINDQLNGVPAATTQTNLGLLYDKAVLTGADVIFITPNPTANGALMDPYVAAMRNVAATKGAKIADFYAYVGGLTSGMPSGGMFDSLHPSATGYDYEAAFIKSIIAP